MVGDLTDTRELLEAIVRIAPGLVRVNRCAILAYDESSREFRMSVYFAPPGGGSPFEGLRIAESDMPRLAHRLVSLHLPALVMPDSPDHALPAAVVTRLGLRSALLVPLVSHGRTLGLLWLDHSEHGHYFTSKEVNIAQGVATSVAMALDSASRQDALALERRRFEALCRALFDGVLVLDRDFRILEMDPAAEDLLGWQTSEVRGRRVHEIFGITQAEASIAWTRRVVAPSPASKPLRLRTRAGQIVSCVVLAVPVRGEGGEMVQVLYVLQARRNARGPRTETPLPKPSR